MLPTDGKDLVPLGCHEQKRLVTLIYDVYNTFASKNADTPVTLQKGTWKAVTSLFEPGAGSTIPAENPIDPPEDAEKKPWLSTESSTIAVSELIDRKDKEAAIESALSREVIEHTDFIRLTSTLKNMLTSMCYFGYAASKHCRGVCQR
mmetsp:Transcript_3096/g.7558  ORF Transcript_3096/g.7558 Transcript_3096/m.7558 type:complete len:148 (-) Transcript_3096:278-721(-)